MGYVICLVPIVKHATLVLDPYVSTLVLGQVLDIVDDRFSIRNGVTAPVVISGSPTFTVNSSFDSDEAKGTVIIIKMVNDAINLVFIIFLLYAMI